MSTRILYSKWKKLLCNFTAWVRLETTFIETTGFVFMNSDTYDMGNKKNKDPNKRAKRRATGTTKIKFKE